MVVSTSSPTTAKASGTLFGITQCCPNNLVRVDPATGQQTVVANLSPSTGFAGFQSAAALDPASHTVFVLRITFPPPPGPPVNELLSVNDQTGALSAVPLTTGLFALAFDASSGTLFGATQCCPNNLVQVDPATGQQTVVANLSPSSGFAGFQSATALDPASHMVFMLRINIPPPPSPPVNELLGVNDQTGALSAIPLTTGLFALAFEAPAITPESIKADVLQAAAGGAIRNSGLTNALLATLNEAASARAAGNCATAANIYQAFINQLQAQSDKGVASDAAAKLVSEAQFLAANCP